MQNRCIPSARLAAASLAALALASTAATQTTLDYELVAEGLADVVGVDAPPGDDRVFVADHNGVIWIARDGVVDPTPYLDISAKVPPPPQGEAGFLGLVFHPDYAQNGHLYVHYTDLNFDTVIERYTVSSTDEDLADPSSASLVLFQPQPGPIHNGGGIKFGPDGYLYIALGDGGVFDCQAQDLGSLFGKLLRIDVDSAQPYAIPPDNPFVGVPGAAEEVYHYGLRNPWRFTVDPGTGDIYIGDVGANDWEEIDYSPGGVSGLNFGWPLQEAEACFTTFTCTGTWPSCGDPGFTDPILTRAHFTSPTDPFYVAMIGGEVYRGCALPELQGRYFFTDYFTSTVDSFVYDPVGGVQDMRDHTSEVGAFYPESSFITSFGVDGDGELLFVYQATPELDAKVYRIVPAAAPAGLVDCNGDGFDDLCQADKDPTLDLNFDGVLDECQGLSSQTATFSISNGGQQRFKLHPGSQYANRFYFLAGSITGTAGIPAWSVTIPLTYDVYTSVGLNNPNLPPLFNNFGVLNGSGEGLAAFLAGPNEVDPVLIGFQAYHAYGVFNAFGEIDYASNFVSLTFLP